MRRTYRRAIAAAVALGMLLSPVAVQQETADAAAIISMTGMNAGGMPVPAGAGAATAAGNTTAGRTTEENSAARAETAIMLPCA